MKSSIIILLTFISIQLSAQKALLYEISGNGLEKPSYLYGTIHVICSNDFIWRESLSQKVKESEQIALELDMDDPKMMMKMLEMSNFKNGQTIKSIMSEADYAKLSKFFKDSLSLSLNMMNKLKPFSLLSVMTNQLMDCEIKSYEIEFVKVAKEQKKEVIGLETIEFQLNLFDKISNEDVVKMLLEMVDSYTTAKKDFAELISHYKNQEVDNLYNDMNKSSSGFKGYEKAFLDDRNQDWIPKIKKIASEKSTVFAVGAGHLGGENGVLSLLKKAGFVVKVVE
jgi:uncharacterized protein